MATAVCHRQEVGTWQSIFPADQLTGQKSAFFVKKLLAVSVSYLTYLRNIFPENAYSNRNMEDLELKILSDSSSCPGANKVCHWIRSCFEALDKKFLNSLVLGLYVDPADSNTLLESYSFKFNYEDGVDIYHNDKKILSSDTENTKKTTTTLLRTILVLTQGLKPLPDNVMLTMKLYFNDEVTPPDYHPAGFMEAKSDDFMYEDETINIKVGEVSTKFHSVKMRIRTKCHNFDLSPDAKDIVAELTDGSQEEKPMESTSPADTVMTTTTPKTDGGSYDVDCVCGSSIEDGMLIMCVSCEKWSHGLCYRILDSVAVPDTHTCAKCPGECTDTSFKKLDKITVQATALWRRALFTLTEVKRVKEAELAQRLDIDIEVAKKLITRLISERFIRVPAKNTSKFGYIVNKTEITKRGFRTYFTSPSSQSQSLSLYDSLNDSGLVQDTESLKLTGEKRKRVADENGDSFELSSSQSWTKGKRLRSSEIRTPVRL
ncbi:HORMA domain-containing protein 1-like [Bolinopsis microptera]|uniref:HORMA domain-containing protein 1-like n=1 Tax=Bolinopsis microptera TaxID=2820187 RepID=UPI003079213F